MCWRMVLSTLLSWVRLLGSSDQLPQPPFSLPRRRAGRFCWHSKMTQVDTNLPLSGTSCVPWFGALRQAIAKNQKGYVTNLDEFGALRQAISKNQKGYATYQQTLPHHTTTACQRQNRNGPVSSLKDSGIDTEIGEEGKYYVEMHLINS
jgi:hypothetical protein